MADTTYVDGSTIITADSMNDLNRLHYTIFGDPAVSSRPNVFLRPVINDQTNRVESTSQFSIQGSGYTANHFLDGTAYYIGQNSQIRTLRMYSGSTSTLGVELTAGATAWASISDERLKADFQPIMNAAAKVTSLRHVTGRYASDTPAIRRAFLIGQDVQRVLPEAISVDAEGTLRLRYQEVIPLHGAAITEHEKEIQTLKARLAALENAQAITPASR